MLTSNHGDILMKCLNKLDVVRELAKGKEWYGVETVVDDVIGTLSEVIEELDRGTEKKAA